MSYSIRLRSFYCLLFLVSSLFSFADDPFELPGGGNQPNQAPVDDYVLIFLIIGVFLIYYFTKKKQSLIR